MICTERQWTITTTTSKILDSNPVRKGALIVNLSPDTSIYIMLGKQATVNRGILLVQGGGSYEINFTNPWTGEVWAVSSDSETLTTLEMQ